MPENDKNLRETLKDAFAETTDTPKAPEKETKEELSVGDSDETKTGDTPEYVSGIDISDIPEQDRPRIKELLSKKAKLLEDGYQPKFKEVSAFKKAQEELVSMGLDVGEARDVLLKHIEQKRNPIATTTQKKEAVRLLDKLMNEAPLEQKASLEQMRQIILEETEVPSLKQKVEQLEKIVSNLSGSAMETRKSKIEGEISGLTDKYGKDLIEKYKDTIINEGLKHNLPARKILYYVASEDELEEAITVNKQKVNNPLTEIKKKAISSPSSAITSSKEVVDTKKPWKEYLRELAKK